MLYPISRGSVALSLVETYVSVTNKFELKFEHNTGACPGFLKGGSNISWFPKKRSSDFKGGGSSGLMGGGGPVH